MLTFYHTRKCEGTTTPEIVYNLLICVLPYQEMRGNYNEGDKFKPLLAVLPYQEMRGKHFFSVIFIIACFRACCKEMCRTALTLLYNDV